MNESIVVLESQQDEVFERIVRVLAGVTGVDIEDASVRGCVATLADDIITYRGAPGVEAGANLANVPALNELLGAYEELERKIIEAVSRDMGQHDVDDLADYVAGEVSSDRF